MEMHKRRNEEGAQSLVSSPSFQWWSFLQLFPYVALSIPQTKSTTSPLHQEFCAYYKIDTQEEVSSAGNNALATVSKNKREQAIFMSIMTSMTFDLDLLNPKSNQITANPIYAYMHLSNGSEVIMRKKMERMDDPKT